MVKCFLYIKQSGNLFEGKPLLQSLRHIVVCVQGQYGSDMVEYAET